MKKLLIALFSALLIAGCAQNPHQIDPVATANAPWKVGDIVYKGETALEMDDLKKITYTRVFQGIAANGYFLVQEFIEDNSGVSDPYLIVDMESIRTKHPIIHGKTQERYIEGGKRSECLYDHGKTEKPCAGWYKNGAKMWEGNILNGEPHGKGTYWYRSGERLGECVVNRGTGSCTGWYKDGAKKTEIYMKQGKRSGLTTLWYENGQKQEEANYQNDLLHGPITLWHENGQKKVETIFLKNKIASTIKEWDEDGNEISITGKGASN